MATDLPALLDTVHPWVKTHWEKVLWGALGWVAKATWNHRKRLVNAGFCSTCLFFARVRISASGLIRIRLDDKYLLVRGNRIKTQFQPVGGVFKYNPLGKVVLEKLGFRVDSAMKVDETSREDLRINVPGRGVPALLKWYDASSGRECNPWREFHEELIDSGILNSSEFPHVHFTHIRRKETYVHWSSELKTWEILVADIFELIPTPVQETALRSLVSKRSEKYRWFTSEEIENEGVEKGKDTS